MGGERIRNMKPLVLLVPAPPRFLVPLVSLVPVVVMMMMMLVTSVAASEEPQLCMTDEPGEGIRRPTKLCKLVTSLRTIAYKLKLSTIPTLSVGFLNASLTACSFD